jgi:hypothetical protein
MIGRSVLVSVLLVPGLVACSSTPPEPKGTFTFSEPTEADAVQIETDLSTRDQIREAHGEPTRTKALDGAAAPCTERWFYTGKVDVGLGPMDMLLYVDFDSGGKVCRRP